MIFLIIVLFSVVMLECILIAIIEIFATVKAWTTLGENYILMLEPVLKPV
jgi:hypothetical protein